MKFLAPEKTNPGFITRLEESGRGIARGLQSQYSTPAPRIDKLALIEK